MSTYHTQRVFELEALLYAIFEKYSDGIEINCLNLTLFSSGDLNLKSTKNHMRGTMIVYNNKRKKD